MRGKTCACAPAPPGWQRCRLCAGTDARLHLAHSSLVWGRGGEPRSGQMPVDKCARKYLYKTLTMANFALVIPLFAHIHAKEDVYTYSFQ